jgi:hypothetical protein
MDGQMWAVQTDEQQMKQTEPHVDAKRPPKKPPGRAMMCMTQFLTAMPVL